MEITVDIIKWLIGLAGVVHVAYGLIILIGNYLILRAGGQTAHENYPKVVEKLLRGYAIISISFILFFLVLTGFIPSQVLLTLVSIGAGVAIGAWKSKD